MPKIKSILLVFLIAVLLYTRFAGLNWGLPYPFHPDERNMAVAVQGLECKISNFKFQISKCLNPHFFAYGQFPLYLGYLGIQLKHLFTGKFYQPTTFEEAVIALRLISAIASIINVFILLKIIQLFINKELFINRKTIIFLVLIFSPFFIQFSHFGTTESLLMLLYSLIIYHSLKLIDGTVKGFFTQWIWLAVFAGMAIATKVSSLVFMTVPFMAFLIIKDSFLNKAFLLLRFIFYSVSFSVLLSPHNLISLPDFFSAINYESGVALGKIMVFYTRQFIGTLPVAFQLKNIFPYVFGWPVFISGILGFFVMSWRNAKINFLRFAFFVYFLPNAFFFAKWTRFMSPIFPLILIFALLFLLQLKLSKIFLTLAVVLMIVPGIAYFSIYQNQDVRLQASEWIYKNIKENSNILSETANVVDIPVQIQNYHIVSFDFYDLDADPLLQAEYQIYISSADYIFVPSRRLFKNHAADKYPILAEYYRRLFSQEAGFKKVAEFSSYPKISLFGKTFLEFPDENAEETWSVFDHPVIRIYQKIAKFQNTNK